MEQILQKTHFTCTKTKIKNNNKKMSTIIINDQESSEINELVVAKSVDKNCNLLNISNLVPYSSQDKVSQLSSELNELEICNDEFEELHEVLPALKNLTKLKIQNNTFTSFPKTICNLQNLIVLNLSKNNLNVLPDSLSEMKNLEELDVSCNNLDNLPESFVNLRKIKKLNICNNKFQMLPNCVRDGMPILKVLDVSKNKNIKMNIIPCSRSLEEFYAQDNGNCKIFPDWIVMSKFFNLKHINLNNTTFDVYSFVGKEGCLNIKSIAMMCSNLSNSVVDMMVENMINLEKINMSNEIQPYGSTGNVFNEIPFKVLKNPAALTELNLRATSLPSISSKINCFTNLKKLDIGLNCISWLPEEICELNNLEYLILDGNGMFMLPDYIGNLKSLKELNASSNYLVRLPESFENLSNLIFVDFYNNKIEEFPQQLLKISNLEGLDVEQNFFSSIDVQIEEKSYSDLYKTYATHYAETCKFIVENRIKGEKKMESEKSDDSISYSNYHNAHNLSFASNQNSSDEEKEVMNTFNESTNVDLDDNWDNKVDTDDEFDPEDPKFMYEKVKNKNYVHQKPLGFCPEDLHLRKIKDEVAFMRTHGSLPTYNIVEGQFDDA